MPLTAKDKLDMVTDADGAADTIKHEPGATQTKLEPHAMAPTPEVEDKVKGINPKRQVWVFETVNCSTGYEIIVRAPKTGVSGIPDPLTGRPLGSEPHKKVKFKQTTVPGPNGQPMPVCWYSTEDASEADAIMRDKDYRVGKLRLRNESLYKQLAEIERMHAEALAKLGRVAPAGPQPGVNPSEYVQVTPKLRQAPQIAGR